MQHILRKYYPQPRSIRKIFIILIFYSVKLFFIELFNLKSDIYFLAKPYDNKYRKRLK